MSNPRTLRPARLAMPVALVAAALLAGCGDQSKIDPETTATLIQPVARVEIQAVTITPGTRTGEQIYKSICAACHDSGAVGAPKTGDAAAWGPRITAGYEALLTSALKGKGAMGAQGGGDFSDVEIGRAVVFMANAGGAKFDEPKPPAPAASAAP